MIAREEGKNIETPKTPRREPVPAGADALPVSYIFVFRSPVEQTEFLGVSGVFVFRVS